MWDPKDRLDADMQYAIRMVLTHGATVEQASLMCGVEAAALRAQISRQARRKEGIATEESTYQLNRHIRDAY